MITEMQIVDVKSLNNLCSGEFFSFVGSRKLYMKISGEMYVDLYGMVYDVNNLEDIEVIIYDVEIKASIRMEE